MLTGILEGDSVRIIIIIAAILSAGFTYALLPLLKKLKAGQVVREDGPESHKSKTGTPTMGGIAIIVASIIAAFYGATSESSGDVKDIIAIAIVMLAYGLIGFIDDYIKVVKKRNLGLTAKQKLALQIVVALAFSIYRATISKSVYIPFFNSSVNFGWFIVPFSAFVMVAMTNAVNLTDGLDGLASSVTAIVAMFFAFTGLALGGQAFAAAISGACIGFLFFNRHPAKIFMGDTGSLALGGGLGALAITCDMQFYLPLAGIIFVWEALSVIIQVVVFKTQNGRRFFKMAPYHHHLEAKGWGEKGVVSIFIGVSLIACVIAFISFNA